MTKRLIIGAILGPVALWAGFVLIGKKRADDLKRRGEARREGEF